MRSILALFWPKGWLRRVTRALLLLIALLLGVVWYFTRPARLTPLAENILASFIHADAQVARASLSFKGELYLTDVVLRVPGDDSEAGRLFEASQIVIGINPLRALIGDLTPRSVGVTRPALYLTEDLATGQYNYQRLPADDRGEQTPPPKILPEAFIDGGTIRFGRVLAGQFTTTGRVELVGEMTETISGDAKYRFRLIGWESLTEQEVSLYGDVDLKAMTIDLRAEGFRVDGPQRNLLPEALQRWWDQADPEGAFPTLTAHFAPNEQGKLALAQARVSMEGLALTLPPELVNAPPDYAHVIRLTDAAGSLIFTKDRVRVEHLTGQIEGIRYTIEGETGLSINQPFHVELVTDAFELPEDPEVLPILPRVVRKYHSRFSPSGRFKTRVMVHRDEVNGPIQAEGRVDILEARAAYSKFPYPCESIRQGAITFNDQRLDIVDLVAYGPSGAKIIINGKVAPPRDGAEVDIHITCTNLPIDQHLYSAMKEDERHVTSLFFDDEQYQRLIEAGLLQSKQATEQVTGVPTYDLGGVIPRIDVHIRRELGDDSDYRVTAKIQAQGLKSVFKFWPYPMVGQSGSITIAPDEVLIEDVVMMGVTGGRGVVSGRIDRPTKSALIPNLIVREINLPIDKYLLASIPEPKDTWVRSLNLGGVITGSGRVFLPQGASPDDAESISFEVDASLNDGVARPNNSEFKLAPVTGNFTLRRGSLDIHDITARRNAAVLNVHGKLDWSQATDRFALDISAKDLAIHADVIGLIPPEHPARQPITDLFNRHQPTGRTDLTLRWAGTPEIESQDFDLDMQPRTLALDLRGERLSFDDMTGHIKVAPGYVEIDQLIAHFATGNARIDGVVTLDEQPTVALTFRAESRQIGRVTRTVLPDEALRVIDALELTGGFHVKSARLSIQPKATDSPIFDFDGIVELYDSQASLGVPVTNIRGDLGVRVRKSREHNWPYIDLDLDADRLDVQGRRIAPLHLRITSNESLDMVLLRELRGSMYGGTLIGRGAIELGDPGRYAFDLALQEVALQPFIDAGQNKRNDDASTDGQRPLLDNLRLPLLPEPLVRQRDTGLLSASLSVESTLANPTQRQGRGAMEIRDARLFEKPLSLVLLQAFNLSLPRSSSFDRVSARYLVMDQTVLFDSLIFDAPTVSITGSGQMDLPTRQLDLTMHNRNPNAWRLGALNELYNTLKDELIAIRVTGTLENPSANVHSFTNIRRTWDDLFTPRRATPLQPGQSIPIR